MKKRLLAAVMAFVLAFSFTACGDSQTQTAPDGQQASVQHRVYGEKIIDYIMDGEGIEPVCEYGYTKISSDEMSDGINKIFEEYNENAAKEVYDTATEYAGWHEEYPEEDVPQYAMDKTVSVTRSDDHAVSFVEMNYSYAGGVHPNTYYAAFNFDAETGKKLSLSDVVSDKNAFIDEVIQKVTSKYPDEIFQGEDGLRESLSEDTLTWSLGYDGITVIFSPYEIASYAAGMLNVTVPYEEESIYADVPEDYVIPMDMISRIEIDGKDLNVIGDYAYDLDYVGTVKTITVSYGDESDSCDASYMSITPYYVKKGDSQFVYIACRLQDDTYLAEVFEISDGKPLYSRQIEGISYGGIFTDTDF